MIKKTNINSGDTVSVSISNILAVTWLYLAGQYVDVLLTKSGLTTRAITNDCMLEPQSITDTFSHLLSYYEK